MRSVTLSVSLLLLLSIGGEASLDLASVTPYIDLYNSQIERAPELLRGLLGNERINIDVTRDDGTVFRLGLEVVSARVNRTVEGNLEDPTIVITTTESAIGRIRSSSDPIAAFQAERESGQVRIQASNLLARAKVESVLSSTGVLQYFYSIFFG